MLILSSDEEEQEQAKRSRAVLNDDEMSFTDETSGCDTDEVHFSESEEERAYDLNDGFDNSIIGEAGGQLNEQLKRMRTGKSVAVEHDNEDGNEPEQQHGHEHGSEPEHQHGPYMDNWDYEGVEGFHNDHYMEKEWDSESLDSVSSGYESETDCEAQGNEGKQKKKKKTEKAQEKAPPVS